MTHAIQSGRILDVAITIPANSGNGSTLFDLIKAGGYQGEKPLAIKVLGLVPAGTNRGAVVFATPRQPTAAIASTDYSTHGQAVAAGLDWYEPTDGAADVYVRSASGSTVPAVCVLFL